MERAIIIAILILLTSFFISVIQTYLITIAIGHTLATPKSIIDEILNFMELKDGETLEDLGSGASTLLIMAVKKHNIKAKGYEISPIIYWTSQLNRLIHLCFTKRLTFEKRDLFKAQVPMPDKIYIYQEPKVLKDVMNWLSKTNKSINVYSYRYQSEDVKPTATHKLSNGENLYIYKLPQ